MCTCTESSTTYPLFLSPFYTIGTFIASEGFEVARLGDARVALIGFPSVGKSTLQCQLTGTESEAAEYEFTTLTCIPGTMHYKKSKVQVLDLPGIIEGAAHGKGRGREVIACARNADAILIVLDGKEGLNRHREILENELENIRSHRRICLSGRTLRLINSWTLLLGIGYTSPAATFTTKLIPSLSRKLSS
jgi:small GTP-binding protein